MARLFDIGIFSANATNGSIGVGYKLYFYTTGTSTPKNTYPTRADAEAGTNANANHVVAAADGRWNPIWLTDGDYKVILKDFDDATLETKDPADDDIPGRLASTASGKGADLVAFSGKTIDPKHLELTENITVSGAAAVTNSHIFVSATMDGTTGDFNPASVLVNISETITQPTAYGTIAGITVNHAIGSGAGKGSRAGIYSVVTGNGTITDGGAAYSYRTGIMGVAIANADEGGGAGSPRGNYYGTSGVATILTGAYVQGVIGAEFDTSIATGATADENMIVQAVLINSHAVKGTTIDAGFLLAADSTATAKLDYGIAFGKTGSKWPVDGTLIGAYACTGGQASTYGVDFSNVTFTQASFKSNGFSVTNSGAIFGLSININNVNMFEVAAPGTPPAGQFYIYQDIADHNLKAKGASGTVTTLAVP